MPKVSKARKLGFILGPQKTFLVESSHYSKDLEINYLDVINFDFPFDFSTVTDDNILENIGENLRTVVDSAQIDTNDLYLSLGPELAVINNLPVDDKLKKDDLREHVLWELEQHLISPVDDYIFDFQKLPKKSHYNSPTILVVAVKKKLVDAAKYIADISDLNLKLVDINIFASVNVLEKNYKLKPKENSVIIKVTGSNLVFIILEGAEFLGFHTVPLTDDPGIEDIPSPEDIYDEIKRNLRFLISDYESKKDEFDRVFLYRNSKDIDLDEILQVDPSPKFEILNPLKKLKLVPELEEGIDLSLDNSEYSEAIGLIIRD